MAGYLGQKPAVNGIYTVDELTSSGGNTYTLSRAPGSKNNIQVSAGGLVQYPSGYSVSGTTLTLSGVPSGQKVIIRHMGETILYPNLDDNIVTSAKIAAGAVGTTDIANDAVTGAKLNPALVAGDLIYSDGTDTINRLAKGAAAQVLTMNSGATAPEWAAAAAGGKVLQVVNTQLNVGTNGVSNNAWADSAITNSITPSATGSRILIMAHFVATQYNTSGDGGWSLRFKEAISGGATNYPEELSSGTNSNYHTFNYWGGTETYNRYIRESVHFVASPNTTSAVTYTLQYGTYNMEGFSIGNNGTSGKSILTLIEIGA